MNTIDRVTAEELSHDHQSSQAPDYSPTYKQAIQNRFERLAKDGSWFMNFAEDELVDCREILQQAALSGNEGDIQQAGSEFVHAVIRALTNKAKDDVGAPWPDPLPTPRHKAIDLTATHNIDINATLKSVFMDAQSDLERRHGINREHSV